MTDRSAPVPAGAAVDVLTLGEAMLALRADQPWRTAATASVSVAGAESNVAIALARAGHAVRWVSAVGDDEPGVRVVRTLRAEGVLVDAVAVRPGLPTGVLLFDRAPAGVTRAAYRRNGSAASTLVPADLDAALAAGARHVHVTGITPALGPGPAAAVAHVLAGARAGGATASLDVNYRSRLWSAEAARAALDPLLDSVTLVVASAAELAVLTGEPDVERAVRRVLDRGVVRVAVPAGAGGARLFTADGVLHAPAHAVPVVDPVGAGDAFTAGLLSGLLDGLDDGSALHRGTVLGACAVAAAGDWEGLPDRPTLQALEATSDAFPDVSR